MKKRPDKTLTGPIISVHRHPGTVTIHRRRCTAKSRERLRGLGEAQGTNLVQRPPAKPAPSPKAMMRNSLTLH